MEFKDVAETIELPSNCGRQSMRLKPRGFEAGEFMADVRIRIQTFEEDKSTSILLLRAMRISRSKFSSLDLSIQAWMNNRTEFGVNLASERWARFEVKLGVEPDFVTSVEKPACKITTDWGGVSACSILIVDQSNI